MFLEFAILCFFRSLKVIKVDLDDVEINEINEYLFNDDTISDFKI